MLWPGRAGCGTGTPVRSVDLLRAGQPQGLDIERLRQFAGGALDGVVPGRGPIRAFGELVNLLWNAGQFAEAQEVENFWNSVGHEQPMSMLCSYQVSAASDERAIDTVCYQHAQVMRDLA